MTISHKYYYYCYILKGIGYIAILYLYCIRQIFYAIKSYLCQLLLTIEFGSIYDIIYILQRGTPVKVH